MQIKHKLILWFSSLVASILVIFSVYVYSTYASFRQRSIEDRLARKARVTEQLLTLRGAVAGSVITSMPEQVELVYSPSDSLIYNSQQTNDFVAEPAFRSRVRRERLVRFQYESPGHLYPKDGVALTYAGVSPSPDGREYVAIATAYDQDGYQRQKDLRDLFIIGNAVSIGLVILMGYLFARQALKPLNSLIDQINTPEASSLTFRLRANNPQDEVGVLAQAFNDLLTRQERLVENQRSFIAQASHELRTPLTTIKGWLETSMLYDADAESLKRGMAQAVKELDKLTALSNGLLQLARIDGVDAQLDRQPLELVEVVLDAADTFSKQHSGQSLSLQLSDGILEQSIPVMIRGNAYLLRTALLNLLDNAAKYSGGQPVTLCLEMDTEERSRIRIEDRGIGLTPGEEERVLLPLVRGSNVQAIDGFGIGLTLAHRIITIHQGKLRLRPRPGGGTITDITLPLQPA
ncbi:HAMP domain-containing sensor histidine kinase [Spirosoma radiotolerans]|uniref:Signal transduction histidine-protein kinase/phosphatase MprB n=1 Tax=Spirosoma radiotolerans TaxID=1379870 RepID=A0A0E3ZVR7_9BACT|nr:HAMP domain-containing sensor histidine kinase [Spirosoma radiotolerans]AKD55293.1 histidine kinase [Spirosoma radiotolerans]